MKSKKLLFTVFMMLISLVASGQNAGLIDNEINNSGPSKLIFLSSDSTCQEGESLAENDIKNKKPFLCLFGSIAPIAAMPSDKVFEQRFKVYYYEYGCSPASHECMIAYNNKVFEYLLSEYGGKWIKHVRNDVIGFNEWKLKIRYDQLIRV